MRRIVLFTMLMLLGLGPTGKVKADLPPPLPPAKKSVAVKIEVDEKAKGPRLVIPGGVFSAPRGRPAAPKGAPQGALEQPGDDGVAENDDATQPRNHMLIAGLALAASLTCGGLWLVRRQNKGSVRGLALLVAGGASLAIGAVAWANAPPAPAPTKGAAAGPAAFPSAYDGNADIEFVRGQEPIRLILDKESFEKLKKGELAPPK